MDFCGLRGWIEWGIWLIMVFIANSYIKFIRDLIPLSYEKNFYTSPFPTGARLLLTANIFAVTPAANPSTCRAYCSTCLLFSSTSSRLGSCGSLKSRVHSSSGKGACLASTLEAFSALRFCCQAVILVCSRASWR